MLVGTLAAPPCEKSINELKKMKDEEIQKKLVELETAILKEGEPETSSQLVRAETGGNIARRADEQLAGLSNKRSIDAGGKSDLHYFGGIFLLLVGVVILFQHVTVTTGSMTFWGINAGNSIGALLVLLTFGVGWIVYNSKSIWGWMLAAVSLFTIIFSVVSGLRIYFSPISMLNMLFMLLPFAFGAAFLLKGMGGPRGVEDAIKTKIEQSDN